MELQNQLVSSSKGADSVTHPLFVPEQRPRYLLRPRDLISIWRKRLAGQELPPFQIILEDGSIHRFGRSATVDAGETAWEGDSRFRFRIRNEAGRRALASFDEFATGSSYINGDFDVEGDFLALLDLRKFFFDRHPLRSLWRFLYPLLKGQVESDKEWVPRHYDYGNNFYFSFLDRKIGLYSQALYRSQDETLEQAALNKLDYIAGICRLQAGSHVLDVGGGWGSFAKYASPKGIDVSMLTISHEQFKYLNEFCVNQRHSGRLQVFYENILAYSSDVKYDAIVLLGVMEHLPDYERLFACFERLVKPNGFVYMDFAAGRKKYNVSSFTYHYIFPGNHTPVVVPQLLAAANRTHFEPVALHNDRHSYFLTLQAWARNLEAAQEDVASRFGERTYRLFQLYLWGCAHQMQRDGEMESYRIAFQKTLGLPSDKIGLHRSI